jgi:hypothetical protein
VRRRDFITLVGGTAAAWPLAAHTQQAAMPVVGFLYSSTIDSFREFMTAFNTGLAETGYVEGRNVAFEYRMAENHFERLPALSDDLVRDRVGVIVTASNVPAVLAAKAATQTVPIVFMMGGDPVEIGLVASLARPGGNVTAAPGTWRNTAHGAACPQLAKADMRAFGRHSGFDPGCVKTLRGITAPGILGHMVMRRAKKRKICLPLGITIKSDFVFTRPRP